MNETQVTDSGMTHLAGLKQLQMLGLSNTKITNEGLVKLKNLKDLYYLFVYGTEVTSDGCLQLKEFIPNLQVDIVLEEPIEKDAANPSRVPVG